jgi:hypothetical protein
MEALTNSQPIQKISMKEQFMKQTPNLMQPQTTRLSKFKKIGLGFLVGTGLNLALADIDMKPTVEEYDKHESGIARLILGGGGVWSLARTFHAGGFAPLGIYGGAAIGYYLIHKARPEWFPL